MARFSRNGSREWCHDRLHRRCNRQAEEKELEDTTPSVLDYTFSQNTSRHHDPSEVSGCFERLPEEGISTVGETLAHMSSPGSSSFEKVRQVLPVGKTRKLVGCMREERNQLDDMQTPIVNAHTPASDQELEVLSIWSSPPKRRRLVHNFANVLGTSTTFSESEPKAEALNPETCEDSGLTAEQHMADPDSPRSSTLEDIDSAARVSASRGISDLAPPQSTSSDKQVEQENLDQVSEQRQLDLHFSSTQNVSPQGTSPGSDDTQSTSQFLLSTGRIWKDSQDSKPTRNLETESIQQSSRKRKTMASGSGEWLQLSLGSSRRSDDLPEYEPAEEQSPTLNPPSGTSADLPQTGIRDFFKFGGSSENEGTSKQYHTDVLGSTSTRNTSPYRVQPAASIHSGESSRRYSDITPETSQRSVLPRPLFVEPRPRTRDSSWIESNVHAAPRVGQPTPASGGNADQFLLPTTPILQKGYPQPAYSNLSALLHHPARVLQPVRSELTETTSVHAWRSSYQPSDAGAGPSSVHYRDESQTRPPAPLPWMQSHHDPPRTPPNVAELLNMTNQTALRDWRSLPGSIGGTSSSFLGMQPPLAQGVDPEQAWRNLLQRVGNNLNVPSGFPASSSSQRPAAPESMLPPADREEYLDALKRAVERFQGIDQGAKEEPLTELQRIHRAGMFPPAQRSHPGPTFDPSADVNLARIFNTPPNSGSKARALASSSDRQRRILRPHAPRPGLWFTLLASNSQPEASRLQQIPTGYIRVVDDNMTVAAVKRYLVNKLGLDSEDKVELTCKGQHLVSSILLQQVRDDIWQSPIINTADSNTSQLLSEGKAWKAPDGTITHVGDVVMVLTYSRPPQKSPTST